MKQKVVIIDYGMGNTGSVKNALDFLGYESVISREAKDIAEASHIILPGVGAFPDCMKNLRSYGLIDILNKEVLENKKPFLGLCLGMQVLGEIGEEGELTNGLGWIKGRVRRFAVDEKRFRVPHVGWNDVVATENGRALFDGIDKPSFYFVHSFHLVPDDKSVVAGTADHGEPFVAAIRKDNIFGVQFHPEKSQRFGLLVLKNFCSTVCR